MTIMMMMMIMIMTTSEDFTRGSGAVILARRTGHNRDDGSHERASDEDNDHDGMILKTDIYAC